MSNKALVWDQVGERLYEMGVSRVALFPMSNNEYGAGVAWNGVIGVTESPSGAEPTALWADNTKYANITSAEEFGATLEAYMYPTEFGMCDGSAQLMAGISIGQQARLPFGLAYETKIGNDTKQTEYGYKLHLIYGCTAAPSERANSTINDNPDAMTMSWEISTVPVHVTGARPTSHLTIDSTKVDAEKLAAFEKILYGSDSAAARLPLPDEVKTLFTPSLPAAAKAASKG